MKASELRIGNLVNCPNAGQNPFRIDEIEVHRSGEYIVGMGMDLNTHPATWYGSEIEPIPLTEEWLLKFGFIYRGIYYHFPNHDIFKLEQYKNKNAFWLKHRTESIDCTRINYVHQLQNLYFALTGKELTIKE